MNLKQIVNDIKTEAERRLLANPTCSGGLRAKIYEVLCEIDREIGGINTTRGET